MTPDERKKKRVCHKGAGHRRRLREKFLASGLSGFHDYEVIELLLTLATPRKDCKNAAKAALKRFKTLQGVCEASTAELCRVEGIGPRNVFGIKLVKAAADRFLEGRLVQGDPINDSKTLFDFLYHRVGGRARECFIVIFLNARNRVIAVETMFEGTLTGSAVYPREVVAAALDHRAAAVMFSHNHPSGDPAPSREDLSITRKLVFACRNVGIVVHEHLVIGDNRYFSFADHGHIARFNRDYENVF